MAFRIPFTFSGIEVIKKRIGGSKYFVSHKKSSKFQEHLDNSNVDITREEYIAFCTRSFLTSFITVTLILGLILFFLGVSYFYLIAILISFLFSIFVFFSRIVYPKVYSTRREKNIEKNLLPALQDMLVQLNAGIPLFSILVNLSSSDYGELSNEFKKAVKRINAGMPQIDVLEDLGDRNSSVYFKRTLWQISNGMRAGSDLSIVIQDSIRALNEEQIIQIQNYGNKLNPLIMFYMLITVIIPSLSITFLTILASMVNLQETTTTLMFIGLFTFVVFIQIMFLGLIKSVRPSLM